MGIGASDIEDYIAKAYRRTAERIAPRSSSPVYQRREGLGHGLVLMHLNRSGRTTS